jgi:hypothetical protein
MKNYFVPVTMQISGYVMVCAKNEQEAIHKTLLYKDVPEKDSEELDVSNYKVDVDGVLTEETWWRR